MVWQVEPGGGDPGRRSTIVGAAHFFPRHFRRELTRLIAPARVVLLEGPLDEAATRKVLDAGRGSGGLEVYRAAKETVHARLGLYSAPLDVHQIVRDMIFGRQVQWLEDELRKLKPWAAFFGIWTRYRAREGWEHKMDLDAAAIAAQLGRKVRYLETIEEQIAALEAVPHERFARFLASGDWSAYNRDYERYYRAGELDALRAAAQGFPTYCEPVVGRRSAVLGERMLPALEAGGACAVVGVVHCPGLLAFLGERGFRTFQIKGSGPFSR
jgi:hypothetical protein